MAAAVAQRDGPGDGPDGLYERAREARHLAQAADAAAQPAQRLVGKDGHVIPSMEQVEGGAGRREVECACQGIATPGMVAEDCSFTAQLHYPRPGERGPSRRAPRRPRGSGPCRSRCRPRTLPS